MNINQKYKDLLNKYNKLQRQYKELEQKYSIKTLADANIPKIYTEL